MIYLLCSSYVTNYITAILTYHEKLNNWSGRRDSNPENLLNPNQACYRYTTSRNQKSAPYFSRFSAVLPVLFIPCASKTTAAFGFHFMDFLPICFGKFHKDSLRYTCPLFYNDRFSGEVIKGYGVLVIISSVIRIPNTNSMSRH